MSRWDNIKLDCKEGRDVYVPMVGSIDHGDEFGVRAVS